MSRTKSAADPYRPRTRSLGEFLCKPTLAPPYIDVDQLPWADIKQDACPRAVVALRRAGKPLFRNTDPVAAFDAEPKLVMACCQRAYSDAMRQHAGYGPTKAGATWRRLLSLDRGFEEIADPGHELTFERILRRLTAGAKLVLLQQQRCGGVKKKTMLKLLRALRQAQRIKESGTYTMPAPLRANLLRLRAATGLPLDTDLR